MPDLTNTHPSPIGPQHAQAPALPPPSPVRSHPPERITHNDSVVIVSDLTIPAGSTQDAVIEIQGAEGWKLNEEYAPRLTIRGAVAAIPPALKFRADQDPGKRFQTTSGGTRIDIPFTGDAPGEDEVSAEIRYGVCDTDSCRIKKIDLTWRHTVIIP